MAKTPTQLTDTPAYKLTNAIYRWFAVSALWLLCSLPVLTAGAATAAAMGEFSDPENYYGHKLVRDYFRRFRACFLPATLLWLMALVLAILLILDVTFYQQFTGSTGWILPALALVLGNLVLDFFRFGCYSAAVTENTGFRQLLKDTGRTAVLCLPIFAIMAAMDLALLTTFVQIPYLLFLLVLLPGFCADIHCRLIRAFLRRYETAEE